MDGKTSFALITILERVTDPRVKRTRKHDLMELLVLAICGAIAGCDSWVEIAAFAQTRIDWFRQFLKLRNGIPSHDTFARVFSLLDTSEFAACLCEWLERLHVVSKGEVIAIDGKTLRGSVHRASAKSPLHLVSAWATQQQISLGQVATPDKSNEITAIPKLLEMLAIKGAIVTIDAMGCQKEIAAQIIAKKGDYVLALKDNHPLMHAAVKDVFMAALESPKPPKGLLRDKQVKRRRTGTDTREYFLLAAPSHLPGKSDWAQLRSIGMVIRYWTLADGTEKSETRYFLTSVTKVRQFAKAVRSHWRIENTLHWTLDVTFSEDKSRIRKGAAPEITAQLRRMVVSLLKKDTSTKHSMRVKRKVASWDSATLVRILTGFSGN
jgi:predicted transposase YbfD/YdcC